MISCALGANSHCAGNLALLSVHFSDSVCGRSVVVLFCFALFFPPLRVVLVLLGLRRKDAQSQP